MKSRIFSEYFKKKHEFNMTKWRMLSEFSTVFFSVGISYFADMFAS